MRVAYICIDPGIPVFGTKGASVHIQEVVRELRSRGHEVTVYATRRGQEVPADLEDLEVVELPVGTKDPAAREKAQQEASQQVVQMLLGTGVDLVYERYSLFSTALAGLHAAEGTTGVLEVNAPLIDEQREHRVLLDEAGAQEALRAQVAAAAATVCVSEPVRQWVLEHTAGGRVHAVANGVSVTRIFPQPEEPGAPVVTFVGTLKPWHGVGDLLQAAALARQPWRLRVIGDGPQRDALLAQAQELGLEVDFRGAVSPEQVPAHLAGSAVGVAPYPDLGSEQAQYFSPLKVYEYLAAGLPVVASAVGQIPQILGPAQEGTGTGFRSTATGALTPPSDPQALASALDHLAADPRLRAQAGAQARKLAQEKHSWSGVVGQILELAEAGDSRA